MNGYLTTDEIAKNWQVSIRRVQHYCNENRIPGAEKHGNTWFVPINASKPVPIKPGAKIKKDIRVLSLFSGCGGMDLGFEGGFNVLCKSVNAKLYPDWIGKKISSDWLRLSDTRFKTIFANDIRPDAKVAWINYFSKKAVSASTYYLDSIVDLVKLYKENAVNVFPENVDIVTGGFPCQDFSIAGKRQGFDSSKSHLGINRTNDVPSTESRGKLYMWMREVISIVKPKIFIAENVKGLANLQDVKTIMESDFSDACNGGYLVIPAHVLHAANYGVPQNRERIIFFGFKKSALKDDALNALRQSLISPEYDPYPPITHAYYKDDCAQLLPFVTVRDCLADLMEPEFSQDDSHKCYSKAKYMGKHCQGQNEINLDSIAPTIRSEHHGNIEYRRLSIENNGKYVDELSAGKKERRLSVRECARIQTFPDDYNFIIPSSKDGVSVSASDAYKLIGNAVPPLLAYHIAKRLEKNWDKYFK